MAVDSVSSSNSLNYVSSSGASSKSEMKVDTKTFLQLLVAQLQYQNPLEPQTDTQFVSQLAQMTSLEQVDNISASMESTQAYNMIGKYILASVIDSKTGITNNYLGNVESVVIQNGKAYVVVGDTAIAVSDIKQVFEKTETQTETAAESGGTTTTE